MRFETLYRVADVAVAAVALIALSPLLLVVAIVVALDSPGGAIYRSERVGKGGRIFRMWKFRTMVSGAAAHGSITGPNDRRVTRVGALMRKSKIDELPQFVNVLAGDMTLVGPRPETPDMVARYTESQRCVLAVKPGVTGRAQLDAGEESEHIPEGVSPEEYYVSALMAPKIQRDLEYLEARTPATDARILLETAAYVMRAAVRALIQHIGQPLREAPSSCPRR